MFKNKTVLITGASSGIGREFAVQLAEQGANLVLTARSADELETIASELKRDNPTISVTVLTFDLSEPESVNALRAILDDREISIDYLVNNAGFGLFCQFAEEDFSTYQNMIALNIQALTALCCAFLPDMKARNMGGIINVASTGSFQPLPYQAVYGASKAYVLSFSEALSGELLDSNVQVMALCPGITQSNFMTRAQADVSKMKFDTPNSVVKGALKAYGKRRTYTVSGWNNYLTSLLPRFLSRLQVLKIVVGMFKEGVVRTERG